MLTVLSEKRGAWINGDEHLLDRLYRDEQKAIQEVAGKVARTSPAVMCQLTFMYFGKYVGNTGGTDPLPWTMGEDVKR